MVAAIGSRTTKINMSLPAQQFLAQGVSTAPAPIYGRGREGGNSGEIIKKLPAQIKYAPSNLNSAPILLNNQSLIESMKAYAIPKQANDVLLANMLQWYKDRRSQASPVLRRKVGAFIYEQKLLIDLRKVIANPNTTQARHSEARGLVLMSGRGDLRWQNKIVNFLSKIFSEKKPPEDPNGEKKAVVKTDQQKIDAFKAGRNARKQERVNFAAVRQTNASKGRILDLLKEAKGILQKAQEEGVKIEIKHPVSRLKPEKYARIKEIKAQTESGKMSPTELKSAESDLKAIRDDLTELYLYKKYFTPLEKTADFTNDFLGL